MRKVPVRLPDGKVLEIEEYENPIAPDLSAADFRARLDEEERFETQIDKDAEKIAALLKVAESGDRALEYWEAGRILLDYRGRHQRARIEGSRGSQYEQLGRRRTRLGEKVARIRRNSGESKEHYSPHYFRKFERFAALLTREQASRPVPYSLQHELIYDQLSPNDRDDFLDRCQRGEITTNTQLRAEVKRLLGEKTGGTSPEMETGTASPSFPEGRRDEES